LSVSGAVAHFAAITPDRVSLRGDVGDEIQETVKIVPKAKYPFKIVDSRVKDGKYISFEVKEDTDGYLLTVKNRKAEPGRYRDTVYLDTDSELMPTLQIRVQAAIDTAKIASVTPPQIVIRGLTGRSPEVSAKIVPKDGQGFKITEVTADKGQHISYKLTEAKEGETSVYTLAVENHKAGRAYFRDMIRLKTTSKTQPEIQIPVMVIVK
jgi:hypothetical protein